MIMAPVTIRCVLGLFAQAQVTFLRIFYRESQRFDPSAAMRAVAKGLILRVAAGAPVMLSGFQVDFERLASGDFRRWHRFLTQAISFQSKRAIQFGSRQHRYVKSLPRDDWLRATRFQRCTHRSARKMALATPSCFTFLFSRIAARGYVTAGRVFGHSRRARQERQILPGKKGGSIREIERWCRIVEVDAALSELGTVSSGLLNRF